MVKYTDLYLFVLFIFQTHACFVNDKKVEEMHMNLKIIIACSSGFFLDL